MNVYDTALRGVETAEIARKQIWPVEWSQNPDLILKATRHQEWLGTEMAMLLAKYLDKHIENCVKDICAKSINTSDVTDSAVRVVCTQLFTYRKIKESLYDTEKFVKSLA